MQPTDAPTSPDTDPLVLYGQHFSSRLLLGTSRYPSPTVMAQAVARSNPAMLTASLRRQTAQGDNSGAFWKLLQAMGVPVLPNTAGCHSLQEPWAAPIGTGKGPINPYALRMLRERLDVPMIVDAGLGLPSHACQVMEWGYDAVLLNTAVALAQNPVAMAGAFANAVNAGRAAFLSGAMQAQETAQASTPVLGTPFWHQA
jgi:thiazole synthase ThiGH ThiG subunit